MLRNNISKVTVMLLCILLPLITLAQGPVDPDDTPIDGGLSLLVAAGAAYGVKKYRDARKKDKEPGSDMK